MTHIQKIKIEYQNTCGFWLAFFHQALGCFLFLILFSVVFLSEYKTFYWHSVCQKKMFCSQERNQNALPVICESKSIAISLITSNMSSYSALSVSHSCLTGRCYIPLFFCPCQHKMAGQKRQEFFCQCSSKISSNYKGD